MVSLIISTKGKPKISVDFPDRHPEQVTVKELKTAVHAKFPLVSFLLIQSGYQLMLQFEPNRQRLTLPKGEGKPIPLTDESKTLGSYGVGEKGELRLKDLGKQVPYRYLYLWEYVSYSLRFEMARRAHD
jgi:very-long-chain enoyl-CoA reductase